MNILSTILIICFILIQALLLLYLLIPLFSVLTYAVIKIFGIRHPFDRKKQVTNEEFDFGIIITAHQETAFIPPLVASILQQTHQCFHIYVIADDCDISNLTFEDARVHLITPSPPLHAKIKSIGFARSRFIKQHHITLILDVDNLLHPRFLEVVNRYFQKGYRVVQADFRPKNEDSLFARIDAVGDMYNFFIDREIRMMAGLSSAIWGSGISFESSLYDEIVYKTMVGGFDKKLQSALLLKTGKIAFAGGAILYDEKIDSGQSLENQRARWILSYFNYFKESRKILAEGIRRFSFDFIYFGFTLLKPPQVILFATGFLCMAINFFVFPYLFSVWVAVFASYLISFATIVLIRSRQIRYLKTVLMLPVFAFRQALSILKLGKASKSFLKTPHTKVVYIEDVLTKKEK